MSASGRNISPREGEETEAHGPFPAGFSGRVRAHQGRITRRARAVRACGVWLVWTQVAKGQTMRLFLPLRGATVLTLRALMGRLPWEPELLIPSQGV